MQDKIIQILKKSDGYVSGEDMSDTLKVSRAAVWKCIDQLRSDGYSISAVPHLGYKLESAPDKLIPVEITADLNTKAIGQTVISLETVDSTMDEAFRLGMDKAAHGTIVCAESQSKGRGRLGRKWVSPKSKGLYFSMILRPKLALTQMPQLTLLTAVALAKAIEKTCGLTPGIKWPNDILIGDKKLAGILTEIRAEMDQVNFVVIGIGLNVNALAGSLVPEATSLRMETGTVFNRIQVLQEILRAFESWYLLLLNKGFEPVLQEWKSRSATLNKRVRLSDGRLTIEGLAYDLDKDGALLIRLDNGTVIKKTAGDVWTMR